MLDLPVEICQRILDDCDLLSQLRLVQSCSALYSSLQITDFFNIEDKIKALLTDAILLNYPHINKLDASGNKNITDNGIKHLPLRQLSVPYNPNITDEGIKNMRLKILNASSMFCNITGEVIQNMDSLDELNAENNHKIKDEHLVNLYLYVLNISYNNSITNKGIQHMLLHTLIAQGNNKITDEGIEHMVLSVLTACHLSGITDKGIKKMNLKKLIAFYNPCITLNGTKHMPRHQEFCLSD